MGIKAIIFDRDGVLTHFAIAEAVAFFQPLLPLSLPEIASKWEEWGAKVGFPRSLSEEKRFFQGLWDTISEEYCLVPAARQQLLQFEYTTYLRPFPEVRSVLLTLRQRELRIGVLSNFSLASLEDSLAAVNLADLVDVACAATVIGAAKPTPEAYLIASRAIGVQPEECLFFDDEMACVKGAQAVGMCAYLVNRQRSNHLIAEGTVHDLTAIPFILG